MISSTNERTTLVSSHMMNEFCSSQRQKCSMNGNSPGADDTPGGFGVNLSFGQTEPRKTYERRTVPSARVTLVQRMVFAPLLAAPPTMVISSPGFTVVLVQPLWRRK